MSKIVRISDEAHTAAKIEAAKTKTTLQDWINTIILRAAKKGK